MNIVEMNGSYVDVTPTYDYKGKKVIIQNQCEGLVYVFLSDSATPPQSVQGLALASGNIEEITISTDHFYIYGRGGNVVINYKENI